MNSDSEDQSHSFVFHYQAPKAGMQDANKDSINKIIQDSTKDSLYYKHQQEKFLKYDKEIENIKQQIDQIEQNPHKLQQIKEICQDSIIEFEKQRQLTRIWAHFDFDMFFVACELLSRQEIKDKPVAVGKSVISTANYVARKYGVRSAMPCFVAKKLCPQLILLDMNYELYKEKSGIFRKILKEYDPQMECMGLDEANLDLTQWAAEQGLEQIEKVGEVCEKIRGRIKAETSLTVSCGVAANKMLAKMCSEIRKPDGLFVLENTRQAILSFFEPIQLRRVPGIGPTTEYVLRGLGIETCKDVLNSTYKVKVAESDLGFEFVVKSSLGIARNVHEMPEDQKSISVQRTFGTIKDIEQVKGKLKEVCKALAEDVEQNNKLGKTITVTIKTFKFEVRNKTMQVDQYIGKLQEIQKEALKVFELMQIKDPIRLIGVKLSELVDAQEFHLRSVARFFEQKTKSKSKQELQEKQSKVIQNIKNEASIQEVESEEELDCNQYVQEMPIIKSEKVTPLKQNIESSKNQIEEQKDEGKQSASRAPAMFECFICGQQIDCQGNNARMNNHIDQCLKKQDQEKNKKSDSKELQQPSINSKKKTKNIKKSTTKGKLF